MKWIKKKIDRGPLEDTIEERLTRNGGAGSFYKYGGAFEREERTITDVSEWGARYNKLKADFITRHDLDPSAWVSNEANTENFFKNSADALGVKDEFGIEKREKEILDVLTSIFDQNAKFTVGQAQNLIDKFLENDETHNGSFYKWLRAHRNQIAETFSSAVDKKNYNSATTAQDYLNALYDDANASIVKDVQKRMDGEYPLLEETLEEAEGDLAPRQQQYGYSGTASGYSFKRQQELDKRLEESKEWAKESETPEYLEFETRFRAKSEAGELSDEALYFARQIRYAASRRAEPDKYIRAKRDKRRLFNLSDEELNDIAWGESLEYIKRERDSGKWDAPIRNSAPKLLESDDVANVAKEAEKATRKIEEEAQENGSASSPTEEYDIPKQKKSVDEYLAEFKNKVEAGNLTDGKIEDLMGLVQSAQKDWTQKKIPAKIAGLLGLKKRSDDSKPIFQQSAKVLLPRIREKLEQIAGGVVEETNVEYKAKGRKARQETTVDDFVTLSKELDDVKSNGKDALKTVLERFRKDLGKGVIGLRQIGKALGLRLDSRINTKDAEEAIAEYVAKNGAEVLLGVDWSDFVSIDS